MVIETRNPDLKISLTSYMVQKNIFCHFLNLQYLNLFKAYTN